MTEQFCVVDAVTGSEDVGGQAVTVANSLKQGNLLWCQGCGQRILLKMAVRVIVDGRPPAQQRAKLGALREQSCQTVAAILLNPSDLRALKRKICHQPAIGHHNGKCRRTRCVEVDVAVCTDLEYCNGSVDPTGPALARAKPV
jgi:DNA-directed RNA polymerase subunit RPC12/RpoP